ncbi:nuclear transport factor 2 family protein [Nonomuraea aurantiaca]|uniref:nuclear transport factor 2 family protein n=1 Tax=Nonomuraea aurantiaca TaxID=2878562 RepID=UPI001CD95370|nr:nuclear transport factor 2 family protein [Nonomuraea aurantiaca]MCA2224063.1 nuclear transport factor 2 family protein [Nonomuraea aurantiaca]
MDDREIADRLQIADVLARYARAVDSGDWDLLDEVFTPDAVIDYQAAGGIRGTRAEAKTWLADILVNWPGRLHLIGATRIVFESGEARVSASFADTLAPSRELVSADSKGLIQGGGWYHHRMLCTADGWRSRELVEEQSWRTIS